MVRCINRGSCRKQRLRHFRIRVVSRPQERSRTVIGGRIYIRVLLDQLSDVTQIIGLGGVSQNGSVGRSL
jgi:hypothetical protein